MLPRERYLHENARMLRLNMTPEEKHLWYDFLKKLPVPVKRQYCIKGYIVDFYIPGKKTVIEVDGLQHGASENKRADELRDDDLGSMGITVLRYSNKSINENFNAVAADIFEHLGLSCDDLT